MGSGCPQTEITSLQEAAPRGRGPLLGLRAGSVQGGALWRLRGRQEGMGPSLLYSQLLLNAKKLGAKTPPQHTSRKGVRSAPRSQGRNLSQLNTESEAQVVSPPSLEVSQAGLPFSWVEPLRTSPTWPFLYSVNGASVPALPRLHFSGPQLSHL